MLDLENTYSRVFIQCFEKISTEKKIKSKIKNLKSKSQSIKHKGTGYQSNPMLPVKFHDIKNIFTTNYIVCSFICSINASVSR